MHSLEVIVYRNAWAAERERIDATSPISCDLPYSAPYGQDSPATHARKALARRAALYARATAGTELAMNIESRVRKAKARIADMDCPKVEIYRSAVDGVWIVQIDTTFEPTEGLRIYLNDDDAWIGRPTPPADDPAWDKV
jgi:hypothetical protein